MSASRFALHSPLPPRAWQPGPLHWLLAGSHVAGVASIAVQPALWPWAVGAMCSSHALNVAFGFAPATTALGPVISQLPAVCAERGEIALTFDDGPDAEVTPRVLDLLEEAGAQATFFCVGARARAHPNVVREIVSRGHAVENHAFGHSRAMGFWGVGRLVRDIGDAQKALADITGHAPKFFRAPFGIRTPLTEPALARLGLRCVAWNVRSLDSVDRRAARVAERIVRRLAPGAIVLMHDGAEGRRRRIKADATSMLGALPLVLALLRERAWRAVTLRSALPA
ncbi:MAG TPA: polysaccharide deacetylase family protein [Burkholderiaceae bacterium]|nr:polysaccharide deacetylase family protein [Burkholderiaceae bacterium]